MSFPDRALASWWVRLLALVLGCSIALGLVEVAIRVHVASSSTGADPTMLQRTSHSTPPPFAGDCGDAAADAKLGEIIRPSDEPDLIYAVKPDLDTCYYGVRLQTNRAGQRAPRDYARPKPDGTFRVLVLGDSVTFAQGVEYERTFTHLIEDSLQAENPDRTIEVINTGVDGYNLYQQAAYLVVEGLSYEPDVVLILFVGNDLLLPLFLYSPHDPFATDRLYVAELLARLAARPAPHDGRPTLIPTGVYIPDEFVHMSGIEGYMTGLRRIGEATRERSIPVLNFVDEPASRYALDDDDAWQAVRALEQSLDIVRPAFVYPAGYVLSEDNQHLNVEGHRRMADRMLAAMRANGVVPGRAASTR